MKSLLASKSRRKVSATSNGRGGGPKLPPSNYAFKWNGDSVLYAGATPLVWTATTNRWNPETGKIAPHNKVLQSKFAASWTLGGATYPSTTTTSWDGSTLTDKKLAETVTNEQHFIYQTFTFSSGQYFSVYAKSGGTRYIYLRGGTVGQFIAVFDLQDGVVTQSTSTTNTITSMGNGWYRCTMSAAFDGGVPLIALSDKGTGVSATYGYAGNTNNGVYLIDAQVNDYALTDYVPTTTAAVYAPRFVSGKNGLALYIEESSTNNHIQSNTLGTGWSVGAATLPPSRLSDTSGPFGDATADYFKIQGANTGTAQVIWNTVALTTTASQVVTSSAYIKAGNRRYLQVMSGSSANSFGCVVDTQTMTITATGVVGTGIYQNSAIVSVGNGWYRVSVTGHYGATTNNGYTMISATAVSTWTAGLPAPAASDLYWYQARMQFETKAYATSYIPTTTAPVIRALERLYFNPTGLITAAQGTIGIWVKYGGETWRSADTSTQIFFYHATSGNNNRLNIQRGGTANNVTVISAGPTGTPLSAIQPSPVLADGWHHFVMTWDSAYLRLYVDGVQTGTPVATPNIPTTIHTVCDIGCLSAASSWVNAPIEGMIIYQRVLSATDVLKLYKSGGR